MNNKRQLFDEQNDMLDKEFADRTFGVVYKLLLSFVKDYIVNYNEKSLEKPQVGDFVVELSSMFRKEINNLGILREIKETENGAEYVIQTVFGQTVNWTNCKMVKIPSDMLDTNEYEDLIKFLANSGVDVINY